MSSFKQHTYPKVNLKDNTLDENDLVSARPLNVSHSTETPLYLLGALDTLPLELLQTVLVQLDLLSLLQFGRVNRRASSINHSIPQFKALLTHTPNTIRAILSIGIGQWITCETLFSAFCTSKCEYCGDFGGYLYLLACRRVCFLCLTENNTCLPISRKIAKGKFGVYGAALDTIPQMRSMPGIYSPNERKCTRRLWLLDPGSARQAGIVAHGSVTEMEQHVTRLAATQSEVAARNNTHRRLPVDPFDGQSSNPLRFMAATQTPMYNRLTQKIEVGVYCVGCQDSHDRRPLHFRRRYVEETFDTHLRECGAIRAGEHLNHEVFILGD